MNPDSTTTHLAPAGGFALLETMRVLGDGTVYLMTRHMRRLEHSAAHFGFSRHPKWDPGGLEELVAREAARQTHPVLFRLLVAGDGSHELQIKPLPHRNPAVLYPSLTRVDSADPSLYHKTTARRIYERARATIPAEAEAAGDVILVNERGEATETSIANFAVLRRDAAGQERWVTPVLSCGLLPGTMRAELLAEGRIVEGLVRLGDLVPGETIRCFNAVRGMWDAEFRQAEAKKKG